MSIANVMSRCEFMSTDSVRGYTEYFRVAGIAGTGIYTSSAGMGIDVRYSHHKISGAKHRHQ